MDNVPSSCSTPHTGIAHFGLIFSTARPKTSLSFGNSQAAPIWAPYCKKFMCIEKSFRWWRKLLLRCKLIYLTTQAEHLTSHVTTPPPELPHISPYHALIHTRKFCHESSICLFRITEEQTCPVPRIKITPADQWKHQLNLPPRLHTFWSIP